jgi:carbon monoxide dehydrogenase subunit G
VNVRDSFEVAAPADEVYAALLDLERVAPCLPGAEGVERVGEDAYAGTIRVRVGPITMRYRADIDIVESDAAGRRAQMRIRAKETRGQGTADANATLVLSDAVGATRGDIDVDVKLSGRAASMGQGAIQDVSSRLVGAFATNLSEMLTAAAPASNSDGADAEEPARRASAAAPISAADLAVAVVAGRVRRHRGAALLLATGTLIGLVVYGRRR